MNSVWTKTAELPEFPALKGDHHTDVLIIGGGITGILCAYLLEQSGINYILVEADKVCSGITKNTTAKITSQHGLVYHKLIREFGIESAQHYLKINELAVEEYCKLCKNVDCDFEQKNSYVYTTHNIQKIERELRALENLGYHATFVDQLCIPVNSLGAVMFHEQAQFHPLKFLAAIAASLNIYEDTKVMEFADHMVKTNHGEIKAERIIVATHFPMDNKHGAYFLKMYQNRSYVIALEHAQDVNGIYVDEDETGLSFRNYHDLLFLGGGGHRTGKRGGSWQELRTFAKENYPEASEKYFWATQDCMTLDAVPYIGSYGKNTKDFYAMTGYNKWGMTSSMVAAMLIRDELLGRENLFAKAFIPQRTMIRGQLFINVFEALMNILTFSKVRCPHMGCALKWNADEHTWDCPCHGSRFGEHGDVIDNPATDDIRR